MQQSEFQQIREWYQQFEDAVLFYRMDGTPLWQNHAAALRQDQDGASLPRYAPDGTPETGTFSVRQGSVLYLLRQKQCRIGGTPVRILKNPMAREYVAREKAGADKLELEEFTLGSLRRAVFGGDVKTGSLMAGQVAGQLTEIRPLRAIFEDLYAGYQARLAALNQEEQA